MTVFIRTCAVVISVAILSGCCSLLGSRWLGYCGSPTMSDMNSVAECLEQSHKVGTDAYSRCLDKKQVHHGF